jgi:hypothetical protein
MYGISVNKKMMEGKRAKKNVNANEEARIFKVPFRKPEKKNFETMYNERPSNPGKTILLLVFR